jgi:hypothetical protein
VKLTTDAGIHAALALLFGGLAVALLWGIRALGLDPLPAAGGLLGTAIFASREKAQARYKTPPRINHAEWLWPAIACGIAAAAGTVVRALL